MLKISFDFDSTLSLKSVQAIAEVFIGSGHDVWITTSRFEELHPSAPFNHDRLFEIAKELGIPKEKIQFTNMVDKYEFLEGFDIHFDDDELEIELIEENLPTCKGVKIKKLISFDNL